MAASVEIPMIAEIVTASANSGRWVVRGWVAVHFRYESADPWAVHFDLARGSGWVTWSFARTLLADGMSTGVGEGDVAVTPGHDGVFVALSSPSGAVTLRFTRRAIDHAVSRCHELVPVGTEDAAVDWSHEWSLLGEVA